MVLVCTGRERLSFKGRLTRLPLLRVRGIPQGATDLGIYATVMTDGRLAVGLVSLGAGQRLGDQARAMAVRCYPYGKPRNSRRNFTLVVAIVYIGNASMRGVTTPEVVNMRTS